MTEATATGLVGFEAPIADIKHVSYHYGRVRALDDVSLTIAKGRTIGVIGPDGVGKSSLLSLISGARSVQEGVVTVFGGDMSDRAHRSTFCTDIAYMPQGLGKNLYPTLSVIENIDFFGWLFSYSAAEIDVRANELLERTGLAPFRDRPAGKLSGGMKQKLGLCCALIHDPALLILDEPTTGIDPLSRQQFWELIETFRRARAGMTVLVATAYMEEAARFDSLIAMNAGQVMFQGTPSEMLAATKAANLDTAFIRMLPGHAGEQYQELEIPKRSGNLNDEPAIVARHLRKRFGDFMAVDDVSLQISRGEIFGFLGSNGCGKSTTMKMLTGLLPATDGEAELFGQSVNASGTSVRRRIGYMSQSFSLYNELTVRQNLTLHACLFSVPANDIPFRVAEMARRFDLTQEFDALPSALPLGLRQRLSLAVAMIHAPDILILDEPTSGVDPIARDAFWRILVELSRNDNVTIFISTHFMNEAERCDRISLMHAGRVLISDTTGAIKKSVNCTTLEEAFIRYLQDAQGAPTPSKSVEQVRSKTQVVDQHLHHSFTQARNRVFDVRRMLSYTKREGLELKRDPVRATLAVLGSVILMFVIGYGINMDVEDLSFAVLDLDDTVLSQDYASDIAGSRYFIEKPPIQSYADLDSRMRSGELSLAIEIPPGLGRYLERGDKVSIGAWIDGAMPQRAETVRAYVQGLQAEWLGRKARELYGPAAAQNAFSIETRFRYNPDMRSLVAMVPAVIPLLLLLIPAMLAALSVVREKELGSITNLYVTPVTRLEFFFGKQIPYVVLGIANFLLLFAFATLIFRVNFTGSFLAYSAAALLYVMIATSIGIVISSLMSSQIAAIFATALLTLIPATQYSGLTDPVSSLKGVGALIGRIYPASYFMSISRGTFSKGLGFEDLSNDLLALLITVPAVTLIGIILIKDQER